MTQPEILAATMSVLDQMTAGVTSGKVAAALTPVGLEKQPVIKDMPGAFMAQEQVEAIVRTLRAAADDIERALGIDPVAEGLDTEVKLMEREADRKAADRAKADAGDARAQKRVDAVTPETEAAEGEAFADRMKRLQANAEAATYADAPVAEPTPTAGSAGPGTGWVCPTHGDANLKQLTSGKGRIYMACVTCKQFEK